MSKGKIKELTKKITEKELSELQEILSGEQKIKQHILNVELDRHQLYKFLDEAMLDKNRFQNSLREKYGDVKVNAQDGTITKMEENNAASEKS